MDNFYNVDSGQLIRYCQNIFIGYGMPSEDAYVTAESLVDADLRNVISHGVVRVGNYVDRLTKGGANPKPVIQVIKESDNMVVMDADDALGAVVSDRIVKLVREKAEKTGMAIGAVRRSNHNGASAHWSLKLAGEDMYAMACSNVEPLIVATGSKVPSIGNNPVSFAFPTKSYGSICYDIACSVMAGGKLFEYQRENKPLPPDAFMDTEGQFTTDPQQATLFMAPFGGHKGYGLAVAVEMLTSLLSGGNFGRDMGSQYGKLDVSNHISHFFMAFDIKRFRELNEYKNSADEFVEYLHSLPKAEGVSQIYFPGEMEQSSKKEKLKNGILLSPTVVEDLERLAEKAGIPEEITLRRR